MISSICTVSVQYLAQYTGLPTKGDYITAVKNDCMELVSLKKSD